MIPTENHLFTEGKIRTEDFPEGFTLDNVCAYWVREDLQCLKARAVHPETDKTTAYIRYLESQVRRAFLADWLVGGYGESSPESQIKGVSFTA